MSTSGSTSTLNYKSTQEGDLDFQSIVKMPQYHHLSVEQIRYLHETNKPIETYAQIPPQEEDISIKLSRIPQRTDVGYLVSKLYGEKSMVDGEIIIKGEKLQIHKTVIIMQSIWLKEKFYGDKRFDSVEITDVDLDTMKCIIFWCYHGHFEVVDPMSGKIHLFEVAERLNMPKLKVFLINRLLGRVHWSSNQSESVLGPSEALQGWIWVSKTQYAKDLNPDLEYRIQETFFHRIHEFHSFDEHPRWEIEDMVNNCDIQFLGTFLTVSESFYINGLISGGAHVFLLACMMMNSHYLVVSLWAKSNLSDVKDQETFLVLFLKWRVFLKMDTVIQPDAGIFFNTSQIDLILDLLQKNLLAEKQISDLFHLICDRLDRFVQRKFTSFNFSELHPVSKELKTPSVPSNDQFGPPPNTSVQITTSAPTSVVFDSVAPQKDSKNESLFEKLSRKLDPPKNK